MSRLTPIIELSRTHYEPTAEFPQTWANWLANVLDAIPDFNIGDDGVIYENEEVARG
jgi:hypothetical protein